ncbi:MULTISPECIES: HD domain-containing phosphohydrolase [Chitinibacter]|uniref:HD domain-containing phosphohydrolase n=1 Tax=Chitinibacter TaxID=230666 RepID=UPI000424235C|nr:MULTISPECIES: HD domain-containing phosphohydrolase [Chitinibacter]
MDFLLDDAPRQGEEKLPPWKVAVIDDERDIFEVTRLSLARVKVDGRPLELLYADSGISGYELLSQHPDVAVAFIDVVMESPEAGLLLVEKIRSEMNNRSLRIILRTGQPNQHPEEVVIQEYDINDYKAKTELTNIKLKTCIYAAIRSYRDIITISNTQQGMEKVISSSQAVLRSRTLHQFGSAVLQQLLDLLNIQTSEVYLVSQSTDLYGDKVNTVLAATGENIHIADDLNGPSLPDHVRELVNFMCDGGQNQLPDYAFLANFEVGTDATNVLYASLCQPLDELQQRLLQMFASNVALIFESLYTKENIQETQKELLLVIGDAIEQRSKETGMHVRRVALMCELLAHKLDMPQDYCETIRYASPLHDIGKIAIPETILHKHGKLDAQEWEIMKTHADHGYQLLKNTKRVIAKMGAIIARDHHEKWDGSGYPRGLAGAAIPLEARIMAVVDVIDALASRRSYKEPWPDADIIALLQAERGKHFDPHLVDVALAAYPEFVAIRQQLPDPE